MCVCVLLLLLLPDRNKQPVTTAFTSRTPNGSRDPFSPYLGKLGSPFYIRYSSRKNFQSLILELDKEKVEKCYRGIDRAVNDKLNKNGLVLMY